MDKNVQELGINQLTPAQEEFFPLITGILAQMQSDERNHFASFVFMAADVYPFSMVSAIKQAKFNWECEKGDTLPVDAYRTCLQQAKAYDKELTQNWSSILPITTVFERAVALMQERCSFQVGDPEKWNHFVRDITKTMQDAKIETYHDIAEALNGSSYILEQDPSWVEFLTYSGLDETTTVIQSHVDSVLQEAALYGCVQIDDPDIQFCISFAQDTLMAMKIQDRADFVNCIITAYKEDDHSIEATLSNAYNAWRQTHGDALNDIFQSDLKATNIEDIEMESYEVDY